MGKGMRDRMSQRERGALKQLGRLALREEGKFWNAYYALPDTMKGALLIGSIRRRMVDNIDRKEAFMELMRQVVDDILVEATGAHIDWPGPKPAPEHERGGNA